MDYQAQIKKTFLDMNILMGTLRNDFLMPVVYDLSGLPVFHIEVDQKTGGRSQSEIIKYKFDELFDAEAAGGLAGIASKLRMVPKLGVLARPELPFCQFFGSVASLPFLKATLLPMPGDAVLALIHFTSACRSFMALEGKTYLCLDSEYRVLGHDVGFPETLGLPKGSPLLSKKAFEFLKFNAPILPPLPDNGAKAGEAVAVAGEKSGFDLVNGTLSAGPEKAWVWENREKGKYSYLQLKERLPVDAVDFRVEIEFYPGSLEIPSVIFRGDAANQEDFPDTYGYCLTLVYGTSRERKPMLILKKQGNLVCSFPSAAAVPGRNVMAIAKKGGVLSVTLNNRTLGVWEEKTLIRTPADNRFLLFLRPGEAIALGHIRVLSSPCGEKGPRELPLTASCPATGDEYLVNADVRAHESVGAWTYENLIFCELEEITAIKRRIDTLENEKKDLMRKISGPGFFLGESEAIKAIRAEAAALSDSRLVLLIEGETGTGKEMLARYFHQAVADASKPFVKVDCAAIPESLLESELFGHEKGAFTGALERRAGRFEQAQGGILFLDEIANIPLHVQAKLLGVLNDFQVVRVGGIAPVPLDIRLICATNKPLDRLVASGRFREDLYYRINQIRMAIPALRERPEDIPLLARHFLEEANLISGRRVREFASQALDVLVNHSWPGNVRELRNTVLRSATFAQGPVIRPADIRLEQGAKVKGDAGAGLKRPLHGKMFKEMGRNELQEGLARAKGRVALFAREAGMSRFWAYTLLKKHGIKVSENR